MAAITATAAWSFVITYILVKLFDLIPFLKLRLDEHEEIMGADFVEVGEIACKRERR
jgi:Amt family ammonium transporter